MRADNVKDHGRLTGVRSTTAESPYMMGTKREFEAKFRTVPSYVEMWCERYGGLAEWRILDFGCGDGITAAGVAAAYAPALVVGTDINRSHESCAETLRKEGGVEAMPSNIIFEEIRPGEVCSASDFDLVYSWSVFEHVHLGLMDSILAQIRDKLRENGLLLIQIAPLFFSPEGSHLWEINIAPWEHLTTQLCDIRRRVCESNTLDPNRGADLWSLFETLNRLTADQLVQRVLGSGFSVLHDYRSTVDYDPPQSLTDVYARDVLLTEQVVLLARRA